MPGDATAGLTLKQVSERTGVSVGTLHQFEKRARDAKLSTAFKLAHFYSLVTHPDSPSVHRWLARKAIKSSPEKPSKRPHHGRKLSQPAKGFFLGLEAAVVLDQFALIGAKRPKLKTASGSAAVSNDCIYPDGVF